MSRSAPKGRKKGPRRSKRLRVFISYSHDSDDHKTWVSNFAYNLRENKIAVVFDQDLKLGSDHRREMEYERKYNAAAKTRLE